jgi:hypothetical protein
MISLAKIQLTLSPEAVMRHRREQQIKDCPTGKRKKIPQIIHIIECLPDQIKGGIPRQQFATVANERDQRARGEEICFKPVFSE